MSTGSRSSIRTALSWLPVGAYTGLIWFLSSRALEFPLINRFPLRDKGVHFFEYGALAFLIAHAVQVTWPNARHGFLAALWLTVGLGLSDELHQAYVPYRTADTKDLLADTLGALCAISVYHALSALRRRRRRRKAELSRESAEARGSARQPNNEAALGEQKVASEEAR